MDRRVKTLIDVQLTCYVAAGRLQAEPIRALTENLSRGGMLIRWVENAPLPPIGKMLRLDVKLPENSEFGPRVMRCRVEVLRVTGPTEIPQTVAVKILSVRFVPIKPDPRDLASMPPAVDRVN